MVSADEGSGADDGDDGVTKNEPAVKVVDFTNETGKNSDQTITVDDENIVDSKTDESPESNIYYLYYGLTVIVALVAFAGLAMYKYANKGLQAESTSP